MKKRKILLYLLVIYALVTWGPQVISQTVDSVADQLNSPKSTIIVKEHLR
jgi:hypothetical protein